MKSIKLFALALSLLFAASAQAAVVITVDDKASDDVAYVNGAGGNLSGADALKVATQKINADPTSTTFEIRILDTDGQPITYTGDLLITRNFVTIHQVPNGNNNDSTVTIKGDGTVPTTTTTDSNGWVAVRSATNFTMSGLSDKVKLVLTVAAGRYVLNCNAVNNASLSYVKTSGTGADNVGIRLLGLNWQLNNCEFSNVKGWLFLAMGDNINVNNCLFTPPTTNGDFFIMAWATHTNFNNCTFYTAGPNNFAGNTWTTFNDCSWVLQSANPFVWGVNSWFNDNTRIIFNRPKFLKPKAEYWGFIDSSSNPSSITLTFNGASPTSKCDLRTVRSAPSEIFATFCQGTIIFNDCIVGNWRTDAEWDRKNADATKASTSWKPTMIFNRCQLTDTDGFGAVAAAWPARKFVANDCTFTKTRTTGSGMWFQIWAAGGQGGIVVNNCTFQGGNDNWFQTEDSDNTTATYTIFKKTTGQAFENGPTINGKNNVVYGGGMLFAAGRGTNKLTGTLIGDPMIDANGKITAAASSAINAAAGSPSVMDIIGNPRPNNSAPDIGAYEFQFPNAIRSWYSFE